MDYVPPLQVADSYNGASHDNFTWSQSINDLDVLVNIPDSLTSPGDLKVQISVKKIKVEIRKNLLEADVDTDEWSVTFEGHLTFPIKLHESLWSLLPGKFVHIHLEKVSERWWEALIIGEPKIQLDKMDCSKDFSDLGEEEQMKLQEMMWKEVKKFSELNNYNNAIKKKE
ncbi:nudC domain-containing protein 3-like [Chelonus insularis]|uniref:nudC domain-containing protein 3-like n=1 Tax=Chelonus insularis TaxID=460826 RepID=UPI00158CAD3D|nr:nudC domain-containing protein 3-like [Chelonus insularis]